jgi:DNA ligase 1
MKILPTLYQKTVTGKIQQWRVWSMQTPYNTNTWEVLTEYGHKDGKLQTTMDTISKGKNLGKSNETSVEQQAGLKAQQLWDKKVKEGYVEDLDSAEAGETSLPGIDPMLAFPIEKKEKYANFPAWVQPKMDGFRCIAIVSNGKAKLFSRTRKEISTLPHIVAALEKTFKNEKEIILDGELYNHELKHDFPRLASLIKRDEVHPDCEVIQYHIYDLVSEEIHEKRFSRVHFHLEDNHPTLKKVETIWASSREKMDEYFQKFLLDGYEGLMYRAKTGGYENKRSSTLLKVKVMQDDEFEIIGVKEGTGKLMGKAGSFICVTKDGVEFDAKMKGSLESLTEYLINFDKYKGKLLTVQFQKYTIYGSPLFPVGVRIREDL